MKARLWPIPFLLAPLALMLTTVVYVWPQPHDGLTWSPVSGEVEGVDPAGPGARAGLQVGDVIVAVGGVPIARASPVYAGKGPGDRVVFSLLRRGEPWQAEITLGSASPHILILRMEPLLIALLLWLVGIVVLALQPTARNVRLFFLVNQVGSGVLSAGLLSTFAPGVAGRLFNILICWLSPLLVHFHSIFPVFRPSPRRRFLLGLFYAFALALSLPYVFWSLPYLRAFPGYLFLYNGVRLYLALAILAGLILLFCNYLIVPSQAVRQRIRLVVFGTALALTPLVTLSLLPEVLRGRPLVAYELSFSFLLLSPLSYGYAVYRHDLFQTDRVLNRSLVYLCLVLLWVGLYLALVAVLSRFLPTAEPSSPLAGAALVLVMAGVLPVLREKVQALVDRLFYGGWYDYRTVVGRFSQALSATLEEAALAELLVEQLPVTLRVRGAALLLSAGDGAFLPFCYEYGTIRRCDVSGKCRACRISDGLFLAANGVAPWATRGPGMAEAANRPAGEWAAGEASFGVLQGSGALARFLQREVGPVGASRLRRALADSELSSEEVALLTQGKIAVWAPLVFQGELEGILLLGSKLADDLYSDEDYRILGTLAWQAATTARNVRLVKELRQRLEEIARSKRDLEEARRRLLTTREEECKRLAREVHDGPLQGLIGMSYRLRDYRRQSGDSALEGLLEALRERSLYLAEELRRICTELRPPALDVLGLASAIRSHAEEEMGAGPPIELELMDDRGQLLEEVAISLFRIYQETLANTVKHADANRIEVRLELGPDSCILSIQDDGCGFVVPRYLEGLAREGHFGLLGMRERAEAVGGRLEVVSTPGAGTEVTVWVPLEPKGGRG